LLSPAGSAGASPPFSLTGEFDAYLAQSATLPPPMTEFLDFSFPSALTESRAPADTYDGSHYSREANERVLAGCSPTRQTWRWNWRLDDLGDDHCALPPAPDAIHRERRPKPASPPDKDRRARSVARNTGSAGSGDHRSSSAPGRAR